MDIAKFIAFLEIGKNERNTFEELTIIISNNTQKESRVRFFFRGKTKIGGRESMVVPKESLLKAAKQALK